MTQYHVEFDVETNVAPEIFRQLAVAIPADAVITEILPEFQGGWYQRVENGVGRHVNLYAPTDIREYVEDYGLSEWQEYYRRVEEPKPYEVELSEPTMPDPENGVYIDGYYDSDWGPTYRRHEGVWEYLDYGTWNESGTSEEDMFSYYHLNWIGTEYDS
jgi:hypothetical protein